MKLSLFCMVLFSPCLGFAQSTTTEATQNTKTQAEVAQARRTAQMAKFDTNKDGVVDASERATAKQRLQNREIKRFDVNKDGVIDAEEKATADQAMAERRAKLKERRAKAKAAKEVE